MRADQFPARAWPPTEIPPGSLFPVTELPGRPWMPRKNGKAINKFTVIRWALYGRKGRQLRTIMVGGTRCTCDAWALEFFEALTDSAGSQTLTDSQRRRDHEAAEKELDAAGIK